MKSSSSLLSFSPSQSLTLRLNEVCLEGLAIMITIITSKRYFITIVTCNSIRKEVWANVKFTLICLNFNTVKAASFMSLHCPLFAGGLALTSESQLWSLSQIPSNSVIDIEPLALGLDRQKLTNPCNMVIVVLSV